VGCCVGFRFRKGVSLLPGVRLNITKRGINSVSLGGKGISYNIGKKGTRATGGLPGSGLSYSEYSAYDEKKVPQTIDPETGEIHEATTKPGIPWSIVAVIALVVLGVYFLRSGQ